MSSEALKSNSSAPSWAYTALHKCIVYLCQPWDLEEVAFPPELVEDPPDEVDDGSELSDHHLSSDDSRSLRSLEINLDYMAYVKRTDSIPSPTAKPRLVDNELTEVHWRGILLSLHVLFDSSYGLDFYIVLII